MITSALNKKLEFTQCLLILLSIQVAGIKDKYVIVSLHSKMRSGN